MLGRLEDEGSLLETVLENFLEKFLQYKKRFKTVIKGWKPALQYRALHC